MIFNGGTQGESNEVHDLLGCDRCRGCHLGLGNACLLHILPEDALLQQRQLRARVQDVPDPAELAEWVLCEAGVILAGGRRGFSPSF